MRGNDRDVADVTVCLILILKCLLLKEIQYKNSMRKGRAGDVGKKRLGEGGKAMYGGA